MNIKQAKIIARMPLEDFSVLDPDREKFYKQIVAFANGATIQYKSKISGEWEDTPCPFFVGNEDSYRIKPEEKPKVDGIALSEDEVQIIRLVRHQRTEEIF